MAPYPSKSEIEELASHLASSDQSGFFDRVSPDVVWDVMGTHPAAGHFTSLQDWKQNALGVINRILSEPLKLKVKNVVGGGEQDWAVIELEANGTCKNGMAYPQRYAWFLHFNDKGIIYEAKAYLDSALVQKCVDANS